MHRPSRCTLYLDLPGTILASSTITLRRLISLDKLLYPNSSQAFKVFVLGRVTLKAFKLLPGNDRVASTLPPDSTITGSNLYSVPESVLLSWMTAHFLREFGAKVRTR